MTNLTFSLIYVVASGETEAKIIGKTLVQEKLVACANILPTMFSYYFWQGNLEEDQETILILKTRKTLVPQVISRVKELHSYDVPAILELPIVSGFLPYLEWVEENTRSL
ncbi:MAG: divalent-cation tolerance protein CutA [Promethearchaeota archaeon]